MNTTIFKLLGGLYLTVGLSSFASAPRKIVCSHYVTNDIPFCTVILTLQEDGQLASSAVVEHAGAAHTTVIKTLDNEPGQKYHLYLDANLEGQEIEMIVEDTSNSDGTLPAVLINHEAPFAKEMHGTCVEK